MDFCFYLITDRHKTAGDRSIEHVIEMAIDGGIRGVLLREKDLPDRELLALAERVRDITARNNVRLLISGRVDVALAVGADGVHLGVGGLPPAVARRLIGEELYMGVSTHSLKEAVSAQDAGADFITFGPVYHTPSKSKYGLPQGIEALKVVCSEIKIPVFALGGVKQENALDTLKAGAYGVAVISAVIGAEDPARAVRDFIENIRHFKLKKVV
jgi:thiamine-phosphate pyrophosphorylase